MGEINWARATNHQHSKNGVVVSAPADLFEIACPIRVKFWDWLLCLFSVAAERLKEQSKIDTLSYVEIGRNCRERRS